MGNTRSGVSGIADQYPACWLRGLVAAGLLAALMSSLASVFNSCSTLFTLDIYKKLRPDTPEIKLLRVGRIATTAVVALGVLWVPIIQKIANGVLYEYLQSVQSYIAPPITAIFLLGIFYSRINSKGALATLFSGLFIAIFRLALEINIDSLTPGTFLHSFGDMNFLTFSAYFFLYCVATTILVSVFTERPSAEQLEGLTFGTLTEEHKAENRKSYNIWDIVISAVIILIVIGIMVSFNGK